ncbi:MAG: hypothetical protein M3454_12450 [Actinomycetota bacterium]|nr:hypothetical protein [Actinomycetota bacterium]
MLKLRRNAALFSLLFIVGVLAPVTALAEENPVGEAAEQTTDTAEQTADSVEQAAEQTTETAEQTAETAEQTAGQTADTAEQTAEQTADTAEQTAEQTADTAEQTAGQTAGSVTGANEQTADTATGTLDQVADNATGTAEQAGGSAQSREDSGNTTKRASADAVGTAGFGISQDASPMPGMRGGINPAGASVAFDVSPGKSHSWDRSSGNDSDQTLRTPAQLLAEVVEAGNQIATAQPRQEEAKQFDFTEWLPGWLPSLLAVTGFSVLLLIGIAISFINGGTAALAWSRRGGRPAPDHAVATVVVSP